MRSDIVIKIRGNINLNNYLQYHSYWYKELIRNPNNLILMENEMKKEYGLTLGDRISKFNDKMELVKTFFDVLK